MRGLIIVFMIILIAGCSNNIQNINTQEISTTSSNEVPSMKISSPEFQNNGFIPKKFTCQGENINPELVFSDVPKNANSLVLIMDDPDAPMGTWDHWILFSIPADVKEIIEDSVPMNAVQGLNSWPKNEYGGPCPPSGTHRYFFKLYALDKMLDLDESADKSVVESAMEGHIIAKAELIGLYRKG